MSSRTQALAKTPSTPTPSSAPVRGGLLQRKPLVSPAAELRRKPLSRLPPLIQAKLTIGRPDDKYEQEADRIADQVMRMPDPRLTDVEEDEEENRLQSKPLASQIGPLVQRQVEPEEEEEPAEPEEKEEEETLQTQPLGSQITPLVQRQVEPKEEEEEREEEEDASLQAKPVHGSTPRIGPGLAAQIRSLKGGGRPLSQAERNFFERRFGHDFSDVRIHVDPRAAEAASVVKARAFTFGRDVVFGPGQYAPGTATGEKLLAHELTHTIQQDVSTPAKAQKPNGFKSGIDAGVRKDASHGLLVGRRSQKIPLVPSVGLQPTIQRGVLDAIKKKAWWMLKRAGSIINPLDRIFGGLILSNIATSSRIRIPNLWPGILLRYAKTRRLLKLIWALLRNPTFHRGGWILRLQPGAGAMTLDDSIFVKGRLSLSTYVHELVHVYQYGVLGRSGFLISFFGMSALTILKRLLKRQPLNPMRSSPHEKQAYAIEADFVRWYRATYGRNAGSISV